MSSIGEVTAQAQAASAAPPPWPPLAIDSGSSQKCLWTATCERGQMTLLDLTEARNQKTVVGTRTQTSDKRRQGWGPSRAPVAGPDLVPVRDSPEREVAAPAAFGPIVTLHVARRGHLNFGEL